MKYTNNIYLKDIFFYTWLFNKTKKPKQTNLSSCNQISAFITHTMLLLVLNHSEFLN